MTNIFAHNIIQRDGSLSVETQDNSSIIISSSEHRKIYSICDGVLKQENLCNHCMSQ